MTTIRKPEAELLAFYTNDEHLRVACDVYEDFPGLVAWLSKVIFWRQLLKATGQQLSQSSLKERWQVEIVTDSDEELFESDWTEMYVVPISPNKKLSWYWYFGVNMNGKKLPFTLYQGIGAPAQKSSLPKALKEMEVNLESNLKEANLKVDRDSDWSGKDLVSFEDISFGSDADVLKRILSGKLAEHVSTEFLRFVKEWSPELEKFNRAAELQMKGKSKS